MLYLRLLIGVSVLAVLCRPAEAQRLAAKRVEGFVVLNSGDTLYGQMKKTNYDRFLNHEVKFWYKDGHTHKFFPTELKAFQIEQRVYESHMIEPRTETRKFLKVVIRGYCTLYEYMQSVNKGKGGEKEMHLQFFVQKQNGKLHTIDFERLKEGNDFYFRDNKELTYDIRVGRYKEKHMPEIVSRYNREREQGEQD